MVSIAMAMTWARIDGVQREVATFIRPLQVRPGSAAGRLGRQGEAESAPGWLRTVPGHWIVRPGGVKIKDLQWVRTMWGRCGTRCGSRS
ncbi:MAG: hypothetical protein CMJ49_13370 [Planctomycetaceae bacterium]|nr:hypothetical protein [Planctomycetaceae bacterium]